MNRTKEIIQDVEKAVREHLEGFRGKPIDSEDIEKMHRMVESYINYAKAKGEFHPIAYEEDGWIYEYRGIGVKTTGEGETIIAASWEKIARWKEEREE